MFDFGICASFLFFFRWKTWTYCGWAMRCDKILCGDRNTFQIKGSIWDNSFAKSTVLKWHAIFVKDLSAVPVRAKPTCKPRSQITEANIEAAISQQPVVKKLTLKLMLAILNKVQGGPCNTQPKLPWCRRKREVKELTKIGYQGVRTYQCNITDSLDCSTIPVCVLCGSVRVRKTKMVFDQTQRVFILEHYFQTQSYARVREVF